MNGFDIPREAQEAWREEYEDTLLRCSLGEHPARDVTWALSYMGAPEVHNGTANFKVYTCTFCGEEWT